MRYAFILLVALLAWDAGAIGYWRELMALQRPNNVLSPNQTYAIRSGATNLAQYCDTQLKFQPGWSLKMLVNIRSNVANSASTGQGNVSTNRFAFGSSGGSLSWYMYYGSSGNGPGDGKKKTGWHFVYLTTTNKTMWLYTNGASTAVYSLTAANVYSNATETFYLANWKGNSWACPWDIVRMQAQNESGTLVADMQATQGGGFTDVVRNAFFDWGISGANSSQSNVTNVTGEIPQSVLSAYNWW